MREIKLVFLDEINCVFVGLTSKEIGYVRQKTKIFDQKAKQTAAYKLGHDDGYRTFFDQEGYFFQWMIPTVIDLLEECGTPLDEVEFIDDRVANGLDLENMETVNEFFLMEETGFSLRDSQINAINAAINYRKGIISHATSAGKTFAMLGIAKAFDQRLKTITVVPSEQLASQTFEVYNKSDLNVIQLKASIKGKKREAAFDLYDHIIITNKLLLNCLDFVEDKPFGLIIDEIHHYFGECFTDAMQRQLSACPVRIGLTGTMPQDKLKRERILCHIGNKEIDTLKPKELIDKKQAATLNITMYTTIHDEAAEASKTSEWEWEHERMYLAAHTGRCQTIAEFIGNLDPVNTLVLGYANAVKIMAEYFGDDVIVDETPVTKREEMVDRFDTMTDAIVFGSFNTVATGISKNKIYRVVIVDAGKNLTTVMQSIGRGLRIDNEKRHLEVIDISSDTKFSVNHRKERKKIYKRESYPFADDEENIIRIDE